MFEFDEDILDLLKKVVGMKIERFPETKSLIIMEM